MKILFLTAEFPPAYSAGAGIVAYNLALGLKDKGHEIFIIVPTENKKEAGRSTFNGLQIFRIYSHYHPRWQGWLSLYYPRSIKQIREIISRVKPDIVHGHNVHHWLSYYSLKVAKRFVKAVFLTAHDVMPFNYEKFFPERGDQNFIKKIGIIKQIKTAQKRYNPFRNLIIRHYLKYADKIFAISGSLKEFLEVNKIKNVEVIYNAVRVEDWQAAPDKVKQFKKQYNLENKKVLFFGGRLSGAKGGDQILQALALVKRKMANFVLLVAGKENEYTAKMQSLIKELDLADQVIFTGWLDQELKVVYNCADLIVFPSLCFEAFGLVNLEAMACRKPVISSYFGGPSEVVIDPAFGGAGSQTGYLINPYDVKLMAEKIFYLLNNPEKAQAFGEAGYQRAKEVFSLEKQVKETMAWYQKYAP